MRQSDSKIGFVGVGRMGANMARRLKDQGETIVAVYDRDPATTTSLAGELSCEATAFPARVAELASIIFTAQRVFSSTPRTGSS
jgi:3-hydroxyisobutyrate dehydrogenase